MIVWQEGQGSIGWSRNVTHYCREKRHQRDRLNMSRSMLLIRQTEILCQIFTIQATYGRVILEMRNSLVRHHLSHKTARCEMAQIQGAASEENYATRKTILIVEDDPSIAEFFKMAIAQETPYHPLLAETGERAFEIVQHVKPALFLLDYVLGTMSGLDLYDSLHAQQGLEAIPAIFLSAS